MNYQEIKISTTSEKSPRFKCISQESIDGEEYVTLQVKKSEIEPLITRIFPKLKTRDEMLELEKWKNDQDQLVFDRLDKTCNDLNFNINELKQNNLIPSRQELKEKFGLETEESQRYFCKFYGFDTFKS